jgi:bifunctional non-homologous end joining protein LigD
LTFQVTIRMPLTLLWEPMAPDKLDAYRRKRDFERTAEPAGVDGAGDPELNRFVVQEHHATRLHWDLRLEHHGVLASWAVPNGIPAAPADNRLAVHTEDHPLEYLEFQGEIPSGEYGAGTMTIWDRGTYETHKWEPGKVEVTFHGERLEGRYGLFPLRGGTASRGSRARGEPAPEPGKDWMIHRMDPPSDPEREPMPERVLPMLAVAGRLPGDQPKWSFEVKWDGVRALAYVKPGRLRLESRNLNEITEAYPEVRGILKDLGMREALLDGEIVAFDDAGRPSFERLQRRMHVTSASAVRRLQASTPVVYAIFDLLYLDGRSLMALPYEQRRARLDELKLSGPAWRAPAAHPGAGSQLLEATAKQGLEGVIAKRLDSRYEPGRRNGAWIKIKHTARQELLIGGWLPGEGRRTDRIGALLMGYHDGGEGREQRPGLRYAGRVGTGFSERTLAELAADLAPLRIDASPFDPQPKLPKGAVFVRPELVAEVEFREWTSEGVMRAPSFKGLRPDKPAAEVLREPRPGPDRGGKAAESAADPPRTRARPTPAQLFETVEALPDGALAITIDGRALKLTNWDKVLYPATGFTKGELIAYYTRIAPVVLPHLRDRPLTLKRYPNGVDQPYFYEKQSPSHRPEWVPTQRIGSNDYTLVQERAALVWLANLADIELHTPLALAATPDAPTMLVFDLDPGAPAGIVECAEVALVLRGLFAQLALTSVVKTSGSKGMQLYVPLNDPALTYARTKPFARRIAELLEARLPKLVVSRMTKRLREGRVLVDWSQNDPHKTTVTVYSMRARERPSVSAPLAWEEVQECLDRRDPEVLNFGPEEVLERVASDGDRFAPLLSTRQELPRH